MEDVGNVGSPGANATALQPLPPDRVNQQNPAHASHRTAAQRESDVHDKIRQFNTLSHFAPGHTAMSKQLERMTADAALKRAMIGREEAETEMRRYREETRNLRKQVEEGRERERKVGERLETVMESYGRAKETYSHTQTIWEKEIRRARKETFKSQSSILKVQEDLKTTRANLKSSEECLEREKELSKAREQEAFTARYQLAALQEEFAKLQERITFLEEERDAFKNAAKTEEVARIAAEGRLPLPPEDAGSEFASPKRTLQGRESLSTFDIVSSAATEGEIEELTRLWQWEKQRADRTQDHLEFVQAEFDLHRSQSKSSLRRSTTSSPRRERAGPVGIVDPSDLVILGQSTGPKRSSPLSETTQPEPEAHPEVATAPESQPIEPPTNDNESVRLSQSGRRESRRGTIFVPAEGIFRTLSQHELDAMEQSAAVENETTLMPSAQIDSQPEAQRYARTPSAEPPSFALMVQERTSLMSLLNAPRESDASLKYEIPSTTGDSCAIDDDEASDAEDNDTPDYPDETPPDPHPSAFYTVTTTTTVPIQDENVKPQSNPLTFAQGRTPSFDVNNPALTPTMTREEALAQIRERRGRARSAMQGAMTPRKQMVTGVVDRNVSAPAGRAAKGRS